MWDGVGQRLQDERIGVPEGVPVVARAGEALGRYRLPLCAGTRLQGVEEGEADRLLLLIVTLELHVGALPEVVEIVALGGKQALPTASARGGERRFDLVAHRRQRALARPAVTKELHQPET